jgi:hypothetical protein
VKLPPREYANITWITQPMPRAPMTAEAAISFAFDWPYMPFLPARCNLCRAYVKGGEAGALNHLDTRHPTWLDEWNATLRKSGIVK